MPKGQYQRRRAAAGQPVVAAPAAVLEADDRVYPLGTHQVTDADGIEWLIDPATGRVKKRLGKAPE